MTMKRPGSGRACNKDIMGTFSVSLQIGNIDGGDMATVAEALVDTGAAYTMLPGSLLEHHRVGVTGKREFVVADGGSRQYDTGVARIAIFGHSSEQWPCPIIFGPEDQYLVGATTLEAFSLMVDPGKGQLVPRQHNARPF